MSIFRIFSIDMVYACTGMGLALFSFLSYAKARLVLASPRAEGMRLLSYSFLVLAVAEWVAPFLHEVGENWHFVYAALLAVSCFLLLASAWRANILDDAMARWRKPRLLSYAALAVLIYAAFRIPGATLGITELPHWIVFWTKTIVFLPVSLFLLFRAAQLRKTLPPLLAWALRLVPVYAVLLMLSPIPVRPLENTALALALCRLLVAALMAALQWLCLAEALDLDSFMIRRPIFLLGLLTILALVFVKIYETNHVAGYQSGIGCCDIANFSRLTAIFALACFAVIVLFVRDAMRTWLSSYAVERRNMETRLRQSRDYLQSIIDALPIPVLVKDYSGVYRLANQAFAKLQMIDPEEAIGKRDQDLMTPDEAFVSRQSDAVCRNHSGLGVPFVSEFTFGINGVRKTYQVTKSARDAVPGTSGLIVSAILDLTEHRRVEAQLDAERYFLGQLINSLPSMVCFLDLEGKVEQCNSSFCSAVGKTRDEIIGRPYREISIFPEDETRLVPQPGRNGAIHRERALDLADPGGTTRHFLLRERVVSSPAGKPIGLIKAFWDTTQLVEARRDAEAAARAKSAFLANMSHELRTPLNGIIGMADMLLDNESASPETRLSAETIINSSRALQAVLDEVLDVANQEGDGITVKPRPFDLRRLVEEVVQIESSLAESLGMSLSLFFPTRVAAGRLGDARRVRQILMRLLAKSARWADNSGLELAVRDTGAGKADFDVVFVPKAGLGAATLGRILTNQGQEKGRRGGPSTSRLVDLVRALGGRFEILDANDARGAVVCRLDLPIPEEPGALVAKPTPDLGGLRILLATSRANLRETVLDYLGGAGAECASASDPEEMLGRLRQANETGDAVHIMLFDSRFISMDKAEALLSDAKNGEQFGNPKIMILTGSLSSTRDLEYGDNLVDAYVSHPLLASDLWSKVEKVWNDVLVEHPRPTDTEAMRRRRAKSIRAGSKTTGLKVKAKVLLVEDNPVNQMVAKGILGRIGCVAVVSRNGAEAVERIESGEVFDLVLMDCMMPVMNGYDATRAIRAYEKNHPEAKRHTIVALTANALPGDREKCLTSGMDGYMTKPVTLEMMRENLIRYCPYSVVAADPDSKNV